MMSKTEYEQNLDANLDEWTIEELSEYLEENCEEAELELILRAIELLQDVLQNSFEFASAIHLSETLLGLSQKNIHDLLQLIFNDLEPLKETVEEINGLVALGLPEVPLDVDIEVVQQWLTLKIAVVFEVFRVPFILQDFKADKIKSPEDWAKIQWDLAYDYSENVGQNRREITERVIHHYQAALMVYTKEALPEDWAMTQHKLANAYLDRIEGGNRENIELSIFHYRQALVVYLKKDYPEKWAIMQHNLGNAYTLRIEGNKQKNIEWSITYYQKALIIRKKKIYPKQWANTNIGLANAYLKRIEGDKHKNLELAIYHYQEASMVTTKKAYPKQWANINIGLAVAYSGRIEGEKRDNIELAIYHCQEALTVSTKEDYPEEWARNQNNLAVAYSDRIEGEKRDNIELAIYHCQEALTVSTKENYPEEWARNQNNLAVAYSDRIEGEKRDNIELAIYHCQEALTVSTKEDYPEEWARNQNNLAIAYSDRIKGKKRENLKLAIYHYQEALTVYVKEVYPEGWAATQNNIALAYSNRIEGEQWKNLELAIYHYQQALIVYTKESYPKDWAMTQNNIALAYSDRIEGERWKNLELAIYHYQQALMVRTKESYPEDWATTQYNLANTCHNQIEGERRENLELAIYHCQEALTVYTKEGFPHDCLKSSSLLGYLHLQQENRQAAIEAYQMAIECIELLTSWTADEDYKQQIIAENITVYDNIIYACVALGKYDKAITYAERGRSRRLVELITSNDLYADAEIPPEIQEYLARYEALEKQLYDLHRDDSSDIGDRRLFSSARKDYLSLEEQQAKLAQIQALEAEKQTLWQEIRRADPVIAQQIQVETISFEEIADLLPNPESAILSIYNTSAETHIFVIRQGTQETQITLHSCSDLTYQKLEELLTEQWLIPYQEDNRQWQANLGRNLQNIAQALNLDQLVQGHLEGIQELIIIPHLGLHHIPFAALPLGNARTTVSSGNTQDNARIKLKEKTTITKNVQSIIHETYLGDQFQIRVLPSCQILKYCHDRPQPEKITYGIAENASDDLKFTHIETQRLKQLEPILTENHLKGSAEVTVKNYQALLERVENIHSAHHAESNLSNPRESALRLGDRPFSLGSLMLKRYPNLNHVFLSCCETNLGQPNLTDDLLTLGTGFLCAGARTVISSLWAVDDLATAIFTSYYYEALKKTQKPSLALQTAQQRLRKATYTNLLAEFPAAQTALVERQRTQNPGLTHPFIEPYYWSAFICQGV